MMKQHGPVVEFECWDSPLLGLQLALCDSFKAMHIFFIGSLVWHCHEFRSFACFGCWVTLLVNGNWCIFGAVHFLFISEAWCNACLWKSVARYRGELEAVTD